VPIPAVAEPSSAVGSARSAVESTIPRRCSARAPNGNRGHSDKPRAVGALVPAHTAAVLHTPAQAEPVVASAAAVARYKKTD
jgi:hypothetical protein